MKKLFILFLVIVTSYAFSQQITQVEYFFDEDPGYGNGEAISIVSSEDIEIDEFLNLGTLPPGMHTVFIRVKDESGNWSPVLSKPFYIDRNNGLASEINYIEYFIDEDPGYGNAIPYTDFNNAVELNEVFFASMTGVDQGMHQFSIRLKNELQQWSQVLSQEFELINCDLSISGEISEETGGPLKSGEVVLYQYFGEGSATIVATFPLDDGTYQFNSVCPNSQYFIKVLPENNEDFLPTYYGDSPYWLNASIISIYESGQSNINIQVQGFADMDVGTGSVEGHIYFAEAKGEPVINIDVVLELEDPTEKGAFDPVAYDRSDLYGVWEMNNLPIGEFRIKVEIPGLEMDTMYYVSITAENMHIDDLNYYIDFTTGIFIEHIGIEEMELSNAIRLFPNPSTNGRLWIDAINSDVKIESIQIYQYSGQLVNNIQVTNPKTNIQVSELAKGFYLMKIQTNKGISVERVIIQ